MAIAFTPFKEDSITYEGEPIVTLDSLGNIILHKDIGEGGQQFWNIIQQLCYKIIELQNSVMELDVRLIAKGG